MEKTLCFRPTRNLHESGFRYIEYGYHIYDQDGKEKVEVVGRYDLVHHYDYMKPIFYDLDLTRSGWFRILQREAVELEWSYGGAIKRTNKKAK